MAGLPPKTSSPTQFGSVPSLTNSGNNMASNQALNDIVSPDGTEGYQQNSLLNHNRSFSVMGFQETTSSMAAKGMRNELNRLVQQMPDTVERRHFANEMDSFYSLFARYLSEKAKGEKINWSKIKSPKPDQILPYNQLPEPSVDKKVVDSFKKLAVLKLNGGLGTTMGCVGPKSAIEVRDGMTFLDLTVRQIEYLNNKHGVNVPLILMNSFNTDADTKRIIHKYSSQTLQILTFNQSRYPRVSKESLLPLPKTHDADISMWYPPGH
ncbi:UTP-glucose-1-phosphate uridylyltransferase, partial [Chytridiales sp. JEL 0842]